MRPLLLNTGEILQERHRQKVSTVNIQVDDETIAAQIQEKSFKKGTGKR